MKTFKYIEIDTYPDILTFFFFILQIHTQSSVPHEIKGCLYHMNPITKIIIFSIEFCNDTKKEKIKDEVRN